jgi:predicted transporter
MIEGWLQHVKLSIKARGVSPALAVWGVVAGIAFAVTLIFLTVAGYIWVERLYDSLTAALVLAGVYFLIAIVVAITMAVQRRRTMERARLQLAARKKAQPWVDPRLLAIGLELGRSIGWKKGLPLAAVGVIAAGIAREWSAHRGDAETKH